jgi:hypothetical protein
MCVVIIPNNNKLVIAFYVVHAFLKINFKNRHTISNNGKILKRSM